MQRADIHELQDRLRRMNDLGWVTYGAIERMLADNEGIYRGWCRNFVRGTPRRMNTPVEEVVLVDDALDTMIKDTAQV